MTEQKIDTIEYLNFRKNEFLKQFKQNKNSIFEKANERIIKLLENNEFVKQNDNRFYFQEKLNQKRGIVKKEELPYPTIVTLFNGKKKVYRTPIIGMTFKTYDECIKYLYGIKDTAYYLMTN